MAPSTHSARMRSGWSTVISSEIRVGENIGIPPMAAIAWMPEATARGASSFSGARAPAPVVSTKTLPPGLPTLPVRTVSARIR